MLTAVKSTLTLPVSWILQHRFMKNQEKFVNLSELWV